MEFGKVSNLDEIDWSLPEADPNSLRFLSRLTSKEENAKSLSIRFGAPAWNHKEWIGSIYPPGTKQADFLYHYSRFYNCIELNTTHYRIPSSDQARRWIEQVPETFQFCPKVFQGISHAPFGLIDRELTGSWIRFLEVLQSSGRNNLGPSFLQLSPYFDYGQKSELFHFLKNWPDEFRLAIEFRHPSWFQGATILPALVEYLQSRTIGLVITDVAGRRDVLHTSISSPYALLRFIGNDLHPSDQMRAIAWAERFKKWEANGLKELYLFIHEPDDVRTPEMTDVFLKSMRDQKLDLGGIDQGAVRSWGLPFFPGATDQ